MVNETSHQCPQCGTSDVYNIKTYCLASQRVGSGTMVAAVPDGGGHHGIGVGLASSKSQSKLAATLSPGAKPSNGCAVITVVLTGLVALLLFSATGGPLGALIAVAGTVIALIYLSRDKSMEAKREAWKARVHFFEQGWVCLRCGHTWLPVS
jgi:hypothetical protein